MNLQSRLDDSASPGFSASAGPIEQVRYGCALGALASVIAIEGAIPITHCGPGCAQKQFHALSGVSGYQGGEFHVPSTNIGNKEVIFGGADRLDELIGSTLKVMEAELYVVQSGCVPGLVGDDVGNVVQGWQRRDVPIVFAETLGYRGTNFTGHETVVRAILDQYVATQPGPAPETRKGLVNVWSLLPYQNPFWRGDLAEIRRILEGIGLTVNILFGPASEGLAEWRAIPSAELNIVLSPWLGLSIARRLQEVYGQPVLHEPAIPIGARATAAFLRKVGEAVGADPERVERFIGREERSYYHYLRDFAHFYAGCTSQYRLPSEINIVSESAYALALAKFFVGDLGLNPGVIVLTENPPESERAAIAQAFRDLAPGVDGAPAFEPDGFRARKLITRKARVGEYPILFGSTWEAAAAGAIGAPLVEISYPATDEVVLARSYVGYRGALQLLERTYTTVVRQSTEENPETAFS
ncbi:nitrogenase molybdenum-iron protein beta chain [Roseiarcus fermentans]|uniref:Nitrogenase molybdenum-iron protein beta chain n=1 Tax=Roseiarcus fermentans TaxID=1473586 RepID=A0A366FSF8_9HYPH|nr:nitrogenase component 1 [Roseiarcus fermentans]RBP17602.1 nitrogenase molybdenum-iron protein beta chain [Roseiarcus fermentans]